MHGLIRGSLLGLFVAAMISAMACRPPADETALAQLQQDIEEMRGTQDQIQATLKGTLDEMDAFRRKVETMLTARPGGGASPQQIQQIENRLKALEDQIARLAAAPAAAPRGGAPAATPRAGERAVEAPPVLEPIGAEPSTGPAGAAVEEAGPGRVQPAPRTGAAATPTPRAEERAPVGEYYVARENDTFESVADQYNISPQQIRDANRIPAGRPIRPGQQYWIPATGRGQKTDI